MVGVKERPILFSGEIVRAILDGRTTQTRRIIKRGKFTPQGMAREKLYKMVNTLNNEPFFGAGFYKDSDVFEHEGEMLTDAVYFSCPYGQPGDRLWVRETWHCCETMQEYVKSGEISRDHIEYRADLPMVTICDGGWTPSIHMPRWASRINLEITAIRVERLQDISEEDAKADGCLAFIKRDNGLHSYRDDFHQLLESINDLGSWNANPWVWVIEFKKV